jgi:transcriptional regulator with XRE-family HTH domain
MTMEQALFDDLMQSLKEAKAIAREEAPASRRIKVTPPDVKAVREQIGLSQSEFARLMRVSIKTLQNWQTFLCATPSQRPATPGLARCKKVLHYCAEWQQEFATMRFGYARVSTQEQDTALQIGALEAAGCERVFQEKASGGRWDRPELHRLFDHLRKGDVLVVWKLDRLSRSLKDLLLILEKLKGQGPTSRA